MDKKEVLEKCLEDKTRIYMLERFLKIYDNANKDYIDFLLFPDQKDFCKTLTDHKNVVLNKSRCMGATTIIAALVACEMCLANSEDPFTTLIVSPNASMAREIMSKIKEFLLQFPSWLWGVENSVDTYTIFKTYTPRRIVLKNGCRVISSTDSPDVACGVSGVRWLIFDGAALIKNGLDIYISTIPTIIGGARTTLISTPNGKDRLHYETCRRAKLKGTDEWNGFELVEMKWYQDPRYNKFLEWRRTTDKVDSKVETIKEDYLDDEGNVRYDPEHWKEMLENGYTPYSEWYFKMSQLYSGDKQKLENEINASFWMPSENVFFT